MMWINVANKQELAPGQWKVVISGNKRIAVFNLAGDYYAIEDICTHDGSPLTGEPLEGDTIVCQRHGARFCIKTGAVLEAPAYEDVATFPVRIENGVIQVSDQQD